MAVWYYLDAAFSIQRLQRIGSCPDGIEVLEFAKYSRGFVRASFFMPMENFTPKLFMERFWNQSLALCGVVVQNRISNTFAVEDFKAMPISRNLDSPRLSTQPSGIKWIIEQLLANKFNSQEKKPQKQQNTLKSRLRGF